MHASCKIRILQLSIADIKDETETIFEFLLRLRFRLSEKYPSGIISVRKTILLLLGVRYCSPILPEQCFLIYAKSLLDSRSVIPNLKGL